MGNWSSSSNITRELQTQLDAARKQRDDLQVQLTTTQTGMETCSVDLVASRKRQAELEALKAAPTVGADSGGCFVSTQAIYNQRLRRVLGTAHLRHLVWMNRLAAEKQSNGATMLIRSIPGVFSNILLQDSPDVRVVGQDLALQAPPPAAMFRLWPTTPMCDSVRISLEPSSLNTTPPTQPLWLVHEDVSREVRRVQGTDRDTVVTGSLWELGVPLQAGKDFIVQAGGLIPSLAVMLFTSSQSTGEPLQLLLRDDRLQLVQPVDDDQSAMWFGSFGGDAVPGSNA